MKKITQNVLYSSEQTPLFILQLHGPDLFSWALLQVQVCLKGNLKLLIFKGFMPKSHNVILVLN